MRFNTNVLVPIVGMTSSLVSAHESCKQNVVLQAAEDGFLNFVLTECLATSGNLNHKGQTPLDAEECVAEFVRDHPTGYPIPSVGDCRDAYQAFVDSAKAEYTQALLENCPYDADTKEVDINDDCVQKALDLGFGTYMDQYPLDDFRETAGYYIGGNQCTEETVTALQGKHAFKELIAAIYTVPPSDATFELIDPATDKGDGLCYSCYHNFYHFLSQAEALVEATSNGVLVACLEDALSEECMDAPLIQAHLEEFKVCSGGHDLIVDPHPKASMTMAASAVLAVVAVLLL